ncbi:hypothetical protein [Novispirillum itersonii]|uniref:hypothetical protein n=1 Tax=Novispirillum itersonii TaxID=189 RepID=UPI0012DC521D|nr:hypothetical protein [Novispirillum itersonii]
MSVKLIAIVVLSSLLGRPPEIVEKSQKRLSLFDAALVKSAEFLDKPHVLHPAQWPKEVWRTVPNTVIKYLDGVCTEISQAVAIKENGAFSALAVVWRCDYYTDVLHIYRLKEGRLELILDNPDGLITIESLTGEDIFPDHAPAFVVDYKSGGSGYEGYRQDLFRVEDLNSDPVLPYIADLIEMKNGQLMAYSIDHRLAGFFDGHYKSGPDIDIIKAWRNGRLEDACKSYPDSIASGIADREDSLAENSGIYTVMEVGVTNTLNLLQIGRRAEGVARYKKLLKDIKEYEDAEAENGTTPHFLLEVHAAFSEVVMRAAQAKTEECPVTAVALPMDMNTDSMRFNPTTFDPTIIQRMKNFRP